MELYRWRGRTVPEQRIVLWIYICMDLCDVGVLNIH